MGLFCGPWAYEFGHEVLWAGVVRALADARPDVTVCSFPESRALYADTAARFIGHEHARRYPPWDHTPEALPELEGMVPDGSERMLRISLGTAEGNEAIRRGRYVRYGRERSEWIGAAVLHVRHKARRPYRNWPDESWRGLVREIGRPCICIGLPEAARAVPGTIDLRGADLQAQMDALRSAAVAVGPSSGPMHLASMCGCPHVTWAGGVEAGYTAKRYREWWNPLGTPCEIIRSWRPALAPVMNRIRKVDQTNRGHRHGRDHRYQRGA